MASGDLLDTYGFDLTETFDKDLVRRFADGYVKVLQRRKDRWASLVVNGQLPGKGTTVKRFIRKGIPAAYRAKAWFFYSGAVIDYNKHQGAYDKWKEEKVTATYESVINADVPRTFPENDRFKENDLPNNLLKPLKRVLSAFVVKNPNIGYCQGMNFIAGIILLVMMPDEEKAFWTFNKLIADILMSFQIVGLRRIQVDCQVLDELLRMKLPGVSEAITKCGASCVLACSKWFICAFVDVLPVQTSIRVLDCVMYEGEKILFRAALALIRLNIDPISKCDSIGDFMNTFKAILTSESVLNCHEFMNCMFSMIGSMSHVTIAKLRKDADTKIENDRR